MKINMAVRKYAFGAAFTFGVLLGSGNAGAVPFNGIAEPATSLPGAGIGSLSVTSGSIESKSQYVKPDFLGLGAGDVESEMESLDWFGTAITPVVQANSGNCGATGSLVTCTTTPANAGTYSGILANLFVVHVGGSYDDGGCPPDDDKDCKHTGGIILAFLYSSLISTFDVSGFTNGVSFIRAFTAPGALDNNPAPVPLPAGVLLLISALGGLGFLGRFRKAGAAA